MSKILSEVLEANAKYSETFINKGKLAMPPARRFAILTCMDARLDPAKFAGLGGGRRPRDPQRRRAGERRRDTFAGDQLQTAGHAGIFRDSPYRVRNAVLHK